MEELLKRFPQWFVALLILAGGVAFLYIAMPPHSKCDSQVEVFKSAQTGFLYIEAKKKKYQETTGFEKSLNNCKAGASHGACRYLFDGLKRMLEDVRMVPSECRESIAGVGELKASLFQVADLFPRLAWGEKAPSSAYDRLGWYDSFHMYIYCSIRRTATELYGKESWDELSSKLLMELPQANQLGRNDAWARSLMSVNCDQYR